MFHPDDCRQNGTLSWDEDGELVKEHMVPNFVNFQLSDVGSTRTLKELATPVMKDSVNTATDHCMAAQGREAVHETSDQ